MANSGKLSPIVSGTTARLLSGGPIMTVVRVDTTVQRPYARCMWIEGRGRVRVLSVDLDGLELASPQDDEPTTPHKASPTGKDGPPIF